MHDFCCFFVWYFCWKITWILVFLVEKKTRDGNEDDVVTLIDPNEVNRSINSFVVDEIVVHINQNEVGRSIEKFT